MVGKWVNLIWRNTGTVWDSLCNDFSKEKRWYSYYFFNVPIKFFNANTANRCLSNCLTLKKFLNGHWFQLKILNHCSWDPAVPSFSIFCRRTRTGCMLDFRLGKMQHLNHQGCGSLIRNQLFTLMRVRILILLLVKVMRICDQWFTAPPVLHFEPPCLHCERPLPSMAPFWVSLNLNFNADSHPASKYRYTADPDPQPCNLLRLNIRLFY